MWEVYVDSIQGVPVWINAHRHSVRIETDRGYTNIRTLVCTHQWVSAILWGIHEG